MIEDGLLDSDLRPLDRLGRRHPRRFNALVFSRAIPGFASQFATEVPERFYTTPKKANYAVVECPCGAEQFCDLGVMAPCSACERIYLYAGRSLRVANPTREVVPATA